jgi:hypothetical protein
VARSLDLSSLTRAEQVVLAASIALVVDGFVPWWYRIATSTGTYHYNAGLTGYGVIAVGAGALAAIIVLARTNIWPSPAPRSDGFAYTVLGLTAVGALVAQVSRAKAEWLGLYVGLGLAIVVTVAGLIRSRARRAGWQ